MLISESITKIRRLINDDSSVIFSDAKIRKLFGREQQDFCRKTSCLTKAVSLLAPPELDYAFCFGWEEGFGDGRLFCPFFKDSSYVCSQPFEQTSGYDLAGDGNTLTSGVDMLSSDPQHPIPFFMPDDYYSPQGIFWDYKWVEQESFENVSSFYVDRWHNRGDVVDYFCHARGLRQKALYLKNMPYSSYQPTNLLLHSRNFENSYWTQHGSVTMTQDEVGVLDDANRAWTIEGNSEDAYDYVDKTSILTAADDSDYCLSIYVKKDTDETRFPSLQILLDAEYNQCMLNTKTGEIVKGQAGDFDVGIINAGDWWRIWANNKAVAGGSTKNIILRFVPAHASVFGLVSVVGVGSTIFDLMILEEGKTTPTLRDGETIVDQAIPSDCIYSFYSAVPDRPEATTNTIEVQEPFAKYIEYKVASRLLKSDTELRDEIKAKHYALRSEIGIQFVKRITNKLLSGKELRVGGILQGRGGRPPAPRFPDHYPAVRIR